MLIFALFDVNTKDGTVNEREKIDAVREVRASGYTDFSNFISDRVTDLKFLGDQSKIRVCLQKQKLNYFIDIQLKDSVATLRKI